MARMPSCDAGDRMFMIAREREHRRIGGGKEEDRDEDQARGGAEFRPAHEPGEQRDRLEALVRRLTAMRPRRAPAGCVGMRHARLHRHGTGRAMPAGDAAAGRYGDLADALGRKVDHLARPFPW